MNFKIKITDIKNNMYFARDRSQNKQLKRNVSIHNMPSKE